MNDERTNEPRPLGELLAEWHRAFSRKPAVDAHGNPGGDMVFVTADDLDDLPPTEEIERERDAAEDALLAAKRARDHFAAPGLQEAFDRWDLYLDFARRRDDMLARRRASGPEYEACTCLGRGGDGQRLGSRTWDGDRFVMTRDYKHRIVSVWERPCPCPDGVAYTERVQQYVERTRTAWRARRVAEVAGQADIPQTFRGDTIETWAATVIEAGADGAEVQQVVATIERWQEDAARGAKKCLLLLAGNWGAGKTGLASALVQSWVDREQVALFRSTRRVGRWLRAAPYRSEDPEVKTVDQLVQSLVDAPLLALDDLGREEMDPSLAASTRASVFDIIDERQLAHRPTIITTNLTIDELGATYGDALVDRVDSPVLTYRVVLTTPNLRRGRG